MPFGLAAVQRAAEVIRAGGLVAFPTETVYGLGADATNVAAVARIFAAKERPTSHPLIVHLASADQVAGWARHVPAAVQRLADRFWPGPLTIILQRHPSVPDAVTGGQETVGLRVPDHPLALALLGAAGCGVAAPSANRFGRVSPTCAEHVVVELGTRVDVVLDGGPCAVGLESTILDLSTGRPRLLRPGAVSAEAIAGVLGEMPAGRTDQSPRVPGALAAHYAPDTPVQLVDGPRIEALAEALVQAGRTVAVLARRPRSADAPPCTWLAMPDDPGRYGHDLYARLRELDALGCDRLLIQDPPADSAWAAVQDRLRRATGAG